MAATLRNNVCDVPIDFDNSADELELSPILESGIDRPKEDDNAPQSSWSSSSGSFYEELETSPIGIGSTWYWHSPSEQPLDKPNWCESSSNSGYITLRTTAEDGSHDKPKMHVQTHENTLKSKLFLRTVNGNSPTQKRYVMAKKMMSTREIEVLQYLDAPASRYDPWNPAPPLLSIVNGDEDAEQGEEEPQAIYEPLMPFDQYPVETVGEAIDLFMQLLQGLVFLQELKIVHGDIHRDLVMMDKGTGSTENGENRITRNVRYSLADFTHATIVENPKNHLFAEDLRDLGLLIDSIFGNCLPELSDIILKMTNVRHFTDNVCASDVLEDLETLISELPTERIRAPLVQ